MRAALAVDQRRAAISRAQRAERRRDRDAWIETGFEPVPDNLTEEQAMREIKGH